MSLLLKSITKEFVTGGVTVHKAVNDLSLTIEKGKFYTLLGPSGCGKTTLLRMIAGFEHPTAGEIIYQGKKINEVPPYKRGFPMVFQSYALFPHMTVAQNIAYGLKLKKFSRDEIEAKVAKALELLDLVAQKDKHATHMSGGQQQRVALARALVMEPEIILLDEPLSNLDAKLRITMRSEIRNLQRRLGITAIYVTHDQEEAMAISDQVVILNQGKIEQKGAPMEIYQKPETEFVARFLGCPNIVSVEKIPSDGWKILGETYPLQPLENDHARPSGNGSMSRAVLRSDSVELSPSSGRHRAVIEDAVFLGSRFQYILSSSDGTKLSIDMPWNGEQSAFSVGDEVTFSVRTDKLHFLSH